MHSLICGKLLGDGCLTKQKGRKPRFQFTHCKADFGWSKYCYEQLSPFLPLNPPKYRRINDERTLLGYTESYIVQSRTSNLLCNLYALWYPNGKKELPKDYIEKNLNEQALAWWYQDDGHLKQRKGTPKKIILSTDNFSLDESRFLISLLQEKFNLRFSTDSQNRLILYDQFQIIFFLHLVDPFMHESMNRKKRSIGRLKQIAERSTIYLPADFVIIKPTSEINKSYNKLPILERLSGNQREFFKQ